MSPPNRFKIYLPFLPPAGRCESAEPAAVLAGFDEEVWSTLLAAVAALLLVSFEEPELFAMAHLTQTEMQGK